MTTLLLVLVLLAMPLIIVGILGRRHENSPSSTDPNRQLARDEGQLSATRTFDPLDVDDRIAELEREWGGALRARPDRWPHDRRNSG